MTIMINVLGCQKVQAAPNITKQAVFWQTKGIGRGLPMAYQWLEAETGKT